MDNNTNQNDNDQQLGNISDRSRGVRTNTTALLTLMDRTTGLDDASKKIIIDSLTADADPSAADRETAHSNRRSFRAAVAWLRHAPGRLARALADSRRNARAGAYQKRRPNALPFRPGYGRAGAQVGEAAIAAGVTA